MIARAVLALAAALAAGSDLVAKAAPDGHTLLLGSIATMAIAKWTPLVKASGARAD